MIARPPRSRAVRLHGRDIKSRDIKRKAPLDANWPALILTDRLYLTSRRWWGCRTGSGLWVLDFDLKERHNRVLTAWTREYGPIPGWHVRSASGGRHVWLRGPHDLPARYRIPGTGIDGRQDIELHANAASQVVWHTAPRYEPLHEQPQPLPDAPDWLVSLTGAPPPSPIGTNRRGGDSRDYGIPLERYVAAWLTQGESGRWHCPDPGHVDETASVNLSSIDRWVCSSCKLSGRLVALAAIVSGAGRREGNSWGTYSSEREAVYEFIRARFPETTR